MGHQVPEASSAQQQHSQQQQRHRRRLSFWDWANPQVAEVNLESAADQPVADDGGWDCFWNRRQPKANRASNSATSYHTTSMHGGHGRRQSSTSKSPPRSPAARAALFTGAYAMVAGAALIAAPETVFGLVFDPSSVPSGWIRVGGILFALIGMQYFGTGWGDTGPDPAAKSFYAATVWSRLFLVAGFAFLVALGQSPPTLLILAAINLVGALTMQRALDQRGGAAKQQKQSKSQQEVVVEVEEFDPHVM